MVTDALSLEQQCATFHDLKNAGLNRVVRILMDDADKLLEVARLRLEGGFHVYGDRMWHCPGPRLHAELCEELADAVVYAVMMLRQEDLQGETKG